MYHKIYTGTIQALNKRYSSSAGSGWLWSKLYKKQNIEHLLKTLQDRYLITEDWNPTFYLGVTLLFYYNERKCKMSMPRFVRQALIKFPTKQQTRHHHLWLRYMDERYKWQPSIQQTQWQMSKQIHYNKYAENSCIM